MDQMDTDSSGKAISQKQVILGLLIDLSDLRSAPPSIVASCEGFLTRRTQRSAQRDAKRSVLCGLCEILGVLCVEKAFVSHSPHEF